MYPEPFIKLPQERRLHNVFHISLLKKWNESGYMLEIRNFDVDELEVLDKTIYEVEQVLTWRKQR